MVCSVRRRREFHGVPSRSACEEQGYQQAAQFIVYSCPEDNDSTSETVAYLYYYFYYYYYYYCGRCLRRHDG